MLNSVTFELKVGLKIDEAVYDMKERAKRENNVILYNVPESDHPSNEVRRKEDKHHISEILRITDTQMEIDLESDVNVITRLGIRGVKPRPIRLVTDSVDSKRRLIKAVDKLKDDNADVDTYKYVIITPDYTKRQRDLNKKL